MRISDWSSDVCSSDLLHRGTEKLMEWRTYLQNIPYFDRLDYVSPMCQEHAFVLGIERLLGITAPPRGQYIRVLFAVITRILNHLLTVPAFATEVGAMTPKLWDFVQRAILLRLYYRFSSAHIRADYVSAARLAQHLPGCPPSYQLC